MRPLIFSSALLLLLTVNVNTVKIGYLPFFKDANDDVNFFDAVEVLVRTSDALGPLCKNHSLLYIRELKKFKLWASEMFDASSKFSTGNLDGSTYDLGNYDQCVKIKVPNEYGEFTGRPCMAKFTVAPPEKYRKKKVDFLNDYRTFYNLSMLDKIFTPLGNPSKVPRNEFYFTYCIPSSCTNDDLENILEVLIKINTMKEFKISLEVDKRTCELSQQYQMGAGDIAFLVFFVTLLLTVIVATLFDAPHLIKNKDIYEKVGITTKILLCFSFPRNLQKLVTVKKESDGLNCIAGIKTITMGLIILGHGLMFIIGSPLQNPEFIEQMYSRVTAMVLLNGPVVVDTFFLITGFLTSYYMLLNSRNKKSGFNPLQIIKIYIHRIIRLTPSYAVVVFFYCTIFAKLGSGIFWNKKIVLEQERCQTSWWANLLYINNYVNKDNVCMFQSWYLSCEIHMFIVAVTLVIFLCKRPKMALYFIGSLLILSIVIVFITVYIYNEEAILLLYVELLKDPVVNSTYKYVYTPSHLRLTPYLIGVIGGYIRYKIKKHNYRFTKSVQYAGWIVCALLMMPTLYTGYVFYSQDIPKDIFFTSLYSSMYHLTWGLSITWMIILVSCGYGAYVNGLLAWDPCVVLSRLSYSTFLVHGSIQMFWAASIRTPVFTDYYSAIHLTCAHLLMSFTVGWLLTMFVESPVLALEKLMFRRKEKVSESTETLEAKVEEKDLMNPKFHVITHM